MEIEVERSRCSWKAVLGSVAALVEPGRGPPIGLPEATAARASGVALKRKKRLRNLFLNFKLFI